MCLNFTCAQLCACSHGHGCTCVYACTITHTHVHAAAHTFTCTWSHACVLPHMFVCLQSHTFMCAWIHSVSQMCGYMYPWLTKSFGLALAGWSIPCWSIIQTVAGSIPGWGVNRKQPINVSHIYVLLSFPSSLSKSNKHILRWGLKKRVWTVHFLWTCFFLPRYIILQ